jgi:hypothetical protein
MSRDTSEIVAGKIDGETGEGAPILLQHSKRGGLARAKYLFESRLRHDKLLRGSIVRRFAAGQPGAAVPT